MNNKRQINDHLKKKKDLKETIFKIELSNDQK
jgi:hypothetical protein